MRKFYVYGSCQARKRKIQLISGPIASHLNCKIIFEESKKVRTNFFESRILMENLSAGKFAVIGWSSFTKQWATKTDGFQRRAHYWSSQLSLASSRVSLLQLDCGSFDVLEIKAKWIYKGFCIEQRFQFKTKSSMFFKSPVHLKNNRIQQRETTWDFGHRFLIQLVSLNQSVGLGRTLFNFKTWSFVLRHLNLNTDIPKLCEMGKAKVCFQLFYNTSTISFGLRL